MAGELSWSRFRHFIVLKLVIITASWCVHLNATDVVQVVPDSYLIISATVHNDTACRPPNSTPSDCFYRRSSDTTPKLNDTVLGPENGPPSPATKVAYILNGSSHVNTYESWIRFSFLKPYSMLQVTIYYYCTGNPPQLKFDSESNDIPLFGNTTTVQSVSFDHISTTRNRTVLQVRRNIGYFYLTEVQFFTETLSSPSTSMQILAVISKSTLTPITTHDLLQSKTDTDVVVVKSGVPSLQSTIIYSDLTLTSTSTISSTLVMPFGESSLSITKSTDLPGLIQSPTSSLPGNNLLGASAVMDSSVPSVNTPNNVKSLVPFISVAVAAGVIIALIVIALILLLLLCIACRRKKLKVKINADSIEMLDHQNSAGKCSPTTEVNCEPMHITDGDAYSVPAFCRTHPTSDVTNSDKSVPSNYSKHMGAEKGSTAKSNNNELSLAEESGAPRHIYAVVNKSKARKSKGDKENSANNIELSPAEVSQHIYAVVDKTKARKSEGSQEDSLTQDASSIPASYLTHPASDVTNSEESLPLDYSKNVDAEEGKSNNTEVSSADEQLSGTPRDIYAVVNKARKDEDKNKDSSTQASHLADESGELDTATQSLPNTELKAQAGIHREDRTREKEKLPPPLPPPPYQGKCSPTLPLCSEDSPLPRQTPPLPAPYQSKEPPLQPPPYQGKDPPPLPSCEDSPAPHVLTL